MMVDLVLFEIAGVRYAADLTQVSRVDRPGGPPSVGAPLGAPHLARRALVFSSPEGHETRLDVDAVLGVRSVGSDELRRLPPMVRAPALALGALIEAEEAILLIDLHALSLSPRGPDGERLH